MNIAASLLLLVVILQNVIGDDFMVQRTESIPVTHENFEESEIVGSRVLHHALRTRPRVRAHVRRPRVRVHRPHVLREQTPEQFLNSDPTLGEHRQFDDSEPILGSPALYNPVAENAPYESLPYYSATPPNWNPIDNNPYAPYYDPNPSYDAVLSILPGQWKDDGYEPEYYESYQVTPVSYVIPDNYQNYYRNADPHKKPKKGKKIVAEDKEDNSSQRHFHVHKAHAHPHAYIYHGNAPLQDVNRGSPQPQLYENQLHTTYPQPSLHESFSTNANFQTIPTQEHQVTTNKQKTVIVLPPHSGNFQISQVNGNQNAVSQSQASTNLANYHHVQTTKIVGDTNSASQSQAPFVSPIVGAPNIVNVGRNRKIWQIPGPDEADINVVIKRSIPDKVLRSKRQKRTVQLARLLLDPNAQMDVPQTLENAGTAVRNSFENKRAPAYYLRNAVGSAKDIFMSALRIPPQDLFIPSRYKIVEKDSYLNPLEKSSAKNGISKEHPETYNKMGTMFRDSVRSGQDVLVHIGDVVHSTRRALATSRNMAPRLVISSLRVPAVQHPLISRMGKDKQHKENVSGSRYSGENDPNFVDVPDVLDSLGLLKPQVLNTESNTRINKAEGETSVNKYYTVSDIPEDKLYQTLMALNEAIKITGADTLQDFFLKIKDLKMKQEERVHNTRNVSGAKVKLTKLVKNEEPRVDAINEKVWFNTTNEAPWDSKEKEELTDLTHLFNRTKNEDDEQVGAINPLMYKKMFNANLESAESYEDTHPAQKNKDGSNDDAAVIGMKLDKKLLTPFMGKVEKKEMHGYDYDDGDSDEDYYDDYRRRRSYVNFIK